MKSELVIDVQQKEISTALLEDSRLVSLQKENRNNAYAVGDIYYAKVRKLMPGLNAAFVDVGYEKDAFLHYLDLGPQYKTFESFIETALADKHHVPQVSKTKRLPDIEKDGTIANVLQPGQRVLVQIAKEPISSKGPRLTTEISFTGRYMVLMPFGDKISISQKIRSAEEKIRLRQLIGSIKPKGFGLIVRTSAEGKRVAELNGELRMLMKQWEDAVAKMQRSEPPALIYEENSRAVALLRDVFSPEFENIYVNEADTYDQIRKYVATIDPARVDIVKLYTKDTPIFDHFNITRQIKSSFGKTVSFKSGAYVIIEHTEALHVIDVNSGNRSRAGNDQESNALEVNLKAADEIARQLRLRDMGGIIVIDFIDMAKSEHRQALYEHMREVMRNDRARHNILPLSKFGLMQITRQRVRPALDIPTSETCPSCFGKGEVQSSILFTDKLREKIDYLCNSLKVGRFTMYVHPYVDAYLKKGVFSLYGKWRRQFGRGVKIVPDESLAYLQYRVVDRSGAEIDLKEESDINSSATKSHKKEHTRDGEESEPTPALPKPRKKEPTRDSDGSSASASPAPKPPRKKEPARDSEGGEAKSASPKQVRKKEPAREAGGGDAKPSAPRQARKKEPAREGNAGSGNSSAPKQRRNDQKRDNEVK